MEEKSKVRSEVETSGLGGESKLNPTSLVFETSVTEQFKSRHLVASVWRPRKIPTASVMSVQAVVENNAEMDKQAIQSTSAATTKHDGSPLENPLQLLHKAENKYEVGKVSDEEEAKQRRLKSILNKFTPQNFEKLFRQVEDVNIDNPVTLSGLVAQIFDKALMEPTFCEVYANLCFRLSGSLPDFIENDEKITFRKLIVNKCQYEFERGELEQAEASRDEKEGEVKQTEEEREEKRIKARRHMLGNIRLIGELYKKRVFPEKIIPHCIQELVGVYDNLDEENLESLCMLITTVGDQMDCHPKSRRFMNSCFGEIVKLSNNQKLTSRLRFMLKDVVDLWNNGWKQRRKVAWIEDVRGDAALEKISQTNRYKRHPLAKGALSFPSTRRPIYYNLTTSGQKGGLGRGMTFRQQPPNGHTSIATGANNQSRNDFTWRALPKEEQQLQGQNATAGELESRVALANGQSQKPTMEKALSEEVLKKELSIMEEKSKVRSEVETSGQEGKSKLNPASLVCGTSVTEQSKSSHLVASVWRPREIPTASVMSIQAVIENNAKMDKQAIQSTSAATTKHDGLLLENTLHLLHKAENKYVVGKVSNDEEAKQRRLKGILNKFTPQNFEKLFRQVEDVNIDNPVTLFGLVAQIFDKALMEPTFCEMYANLCDHLSGSLPDFIENDENITFKRLLLNKCQEAFERGEREQAEASRDEKEGVVKQTEEEREEKRIKARLHMLGNIRLIGELYKKKMLTERVMHECIQKLLGDYNIPDEENIESLCMLITMIGDQIDHAKARNFMDSYFDAIVKLSNNQKLTSCLRFMLKDMVDLRNNGWQQRKKVAWIEDVRGDAAEEKASQTNRYKRHPLAKGALSFPSTRRAIYNNLTTSGQKGRLGRGMTFRQPPPNGHTSIASGANNQSRDDFTWRALPKIVQQLQGQNATAGDLKSRVTLANGQSQKPTMEKALPEEVLKKELSIMEEKSKVRSEVEASGQGGKSKLNPASLVCETSVTEQFKSRHLVASVWRPREIPAASLVSVQAVVENNVEMDKQAIQSTSAATTKHDGLPAENPLQFLHKEENKYEVGKQRWLKYEVGKQRWLKGILNKLMPQNFEKLFRQVRDVNIDNCVTLAGLVVQIFDKALMEPTFCEMYANLCYHLSGSLPDFIENDEKITFKRLLLNKCQEEFERREREQAEASRDEKEGEVEQTEEEKEEKRIKARRHMLGNIRLIGELYKKKMLTVRIMHECIQKLLGEYDTPDEEDLESLCMLITTIGEQIDHAKARNFMDTYFAVIVRLSNNQKLTSRLRFMLKDVVDLRKNRWQQRRKVAWIEDVCGDVAQEQTSQTNRYKPHPLVNGALSFPSTRRPIYNNLTTSGQKGGFGRGMTFRQPPPNGHTSIASGANNQSRDDFTWSALPKIEQQLQGQNATAGVLKSRVTLANGQSQKPAMEKALPEEVLKKGKQQQFNTDRGRQDLRRDSSFSILDEVVDADLRSICYTYLLLVSCIVFVAWVAIILL